MLNISKYISSDLTVIERRPHKNHPGSRLVINDKIYMALTPNVYAWLRRQMEKAHLAYQSGKLEEESWNTLRQRFYPIHDWVIEAWGKEVIEKALKEAVKNPFVTSSNGKHDPLKRSLIENGDKKLDHLYPVDGEFPNTHPVSPEAVGQVDEIRDKTLFLGWTENGLYQNRGRFKLLCGQDYGLVCYLGKGDSIGKITRESIEIIRPSGVRHRFYNCNADQPWLKKTK